MRSLILSSLMLGGACASPLPPHDLKCESLSNPIALGTTTPRFSWKLDAGQPAARALRQTAYEIQVDADPPANTPLWNSGRVDSPRTSQIEYAGKPLKARDRAIWRVRFWNGNNEASPWSEPARFGIGLLDPLDWQAAWISTRDDGFFETSENIQNFKNDPARGKLRLTPAKHFRKEFDAAEIKRATLHATALGVFHVEINGRRVSDERLAPGWSSYHRRIHSRAYDVTGLLENGRNAIGATLADGWYAGYVAYGLLTGQPGLVPGVDGRNYYGVSPAVRLQLELELADGTRRVIATGPDWKCATGPYVEADILQGETYDARKEMPGWSKAGFDDAAWEEAVVKTGTSAKVEPHPGPPVRPIMEMPARTVTRRGEGTYVFDLGQNISGVVRLKVKGKAGDRVTLRHAEILHQDGRLSTENLRCARAVDSYILKGDPAGETWTPEFTYHGFQYVELSGCRQEPGLDAVTGIVLHSDTPFHGSFECSDPMLNRLYQNMVWTQRANFIEMPTDCPQRDERMGWTGDAQVYVRAATFNADIAAFYTKWLRDLNDDQWDYGAYPPYAPRPFSRPNEHHAAGWMDAGIICPWTIWQVYGDTRVIREHWRNMTDFMEWRKLRDPELDGASDDCGFGDWLSLGEVKTPIPFIDLAYHAHDAMLMAEMAQAIGLSAEAKAWSEHAEKAAASFRRIYQKPDGALAIDNQTAHAMALFLGLLTEETRPAAAKRLADLVRTNHNLMTTGFLGTRPLLPALSANGHHDLSGVLIRQREFPSWGYEVENGATTIWERWNSYEKGKGVHSPEMNSFSHYAFGAVCEWMMSELAGIDRAAPGFDRVRIAPRPTGGITRASASMETPHGKLACSWRVENGVFLADVTVPPNTTAEARFPVSGTTVVSDLPAPETKGDLLLLGSGFYQIRGTFKEP